MANTPAQNKMPLNTSPPPHTHTSLRPAGPAAAWAGLELDLLELVIANLTGGVNPPDSDGHWALASAAQTCTSCVQRGPLHPQFPTARTTLASMTQCLALYSRTGNSGQVAGGMPGERCSAHLHSAGCGARSTEPRPLRPRQVPSMPSNSSKAREWHSNSAALGTARLVSLTSWLKAGRQVVRSRWRLMMIS